MVESAKPDRRGRLLELDSTIVTMDDVLADLREEIGKRIRPVVAHLPEESVCGLIDQMARVQLKYQGIPHTPMHLRK